ncbi:MAG: cell wall-binding repeat-containing protein [Actinomycetia bacterium]|nr:cell wall-binding repeat-containing protein [Actinomycetes bacterium]
MIKYWREGILTSVGVAAGAVLVAALVAMSATDSIPISASDISTGSLFESVFSDVDIAPARTGTAPSPAAAGIGGFDAETAQWHLRTAAGDPSVFTFGKSGDTPLVGDWNGDGTDTIAVFSPATGTLMLRNTNTAGDPDATLSIGQPDDIPVVGNFDGNGTDTIALYREDTHQLLIPLGSLINNPSDTRTISFNAGVNQILAGDFNGDGTDTLATYNPNSGALAIRQSLASDAAIDQSIVRTASASDAVAIVGDWSGDGIDTVGVYSPTATTFFLPSATTPVELVWGSDSWIPLTGSFGPLESSVVVSIDGASESLTWAIESLYLELGDAPGLAVSTAIPARMEATQPMSITGSASTAEAFGTQMAVVTIGEDTILATSNDAWTWTVVGGTLPSQGVLALAAAPSPRFVALFGTDSLNGNGLPGAWSPERAAATFADSIHIYSFDPISNKGAIVGIPRDTAMAYTGPGNFDGLQKINRVNLWPNTPADTTTVLANETGLPIEGFIQIGFGASRTGGKKGFTDFLDDSRWRGPGLDFLVPYSTPSQCFANPGPPKAAEGDTHIDGEGALAFSRERKCVPTDADGNPIRNGNVVRTLSQGLLMKAAVNVIQGIGISNVPQLLTIFEEYITTDLSGPQLFSLAETLFEVDPGPLPTLTPQDIDTYASAAYDLNPGTLPNVIVEGCTGVLEAGNPPGYAQFFTAQNHDTFADLADGKLDQLPVYRYSSGNPDFPLSCPELLGSVDRIAGANRYETAANISQSRFPAGVPVAYVATGLLFPDALSGGPVAALDDAPILLAQKTALTAPTSTELTRLKPKRIVILGGPAVISENLEAQLKNFTQGTVTRLAGANRFSTAAAISKSTFSPGVPVAYVSTGFSFPDALAGGPVAGLNKGPILLTAPDSLPGPTKAELARLNPKRIVILGGSAAVGSSVEALLAAYTTGGVSRIAGANRYETAKLISQSEFGNGLSVVYVATGENFPDALAGGPLAGLNTSPIILVQKFSIPNPAKAELNRLRPKRIVILGGTGVISTSVEQQLAGFTFP